MNTTCNNKKTPTIDPEKALKKAKGFMIFGLKSWIKALEIADGQKKSAGKYRYQVSEDASTGLIVLASDGSEVAGTNRSRDDWAAVGKPARLASIGLRARKDELEESTKERHEYTFNVISGEACLTCGGQRLDAEGVTISDWAAKGQPIEMALFQQLNVAIDWGHEAAVEDTRQRMIKYGVIRKPVEKSKA